MVIIMNINDYPEELKTEEQSVLNSLISKMDQVIDRLDQEAKDYVAEAKNAIISLNPDEYISLLLARKGLKDTEENRRRMLEARSELYKHRLLLRIEDSYGTDIQEYKVGLHSCMDGSRMFVVSWEMPICRHFLLDNASAEFDNIITDRLGNKHHTHFTLLVKNEVKLRFTRVMSAKNLFPGIADDRTLTALKEVDFFSDAFLDKIISYFNPDKYNPDEVARIISDEFLEELLERRETPEFKNIVFSIQRKQGELIQAPYERNMIVQGCAGSGKSMIMLHRLPILLYDNPSRLSRTNLYVITPSQMYIQLANNMRHQLEISDIKMGTIEQYYDYCIEKYPGQKPADYGILHAEVKIGRKDEQYIFSSKCIEDIRNFYDSLCEKYTLPLEKAYSVLEISEDVQKREDTYAQRIHNRLLKLQAILRANDKVLNKYYREVKDSIEAFNTLNLTLRNRKSNTIREINKRISLTKKETSRIELEIKKLDPSRNAVAIENRKAKLEAINKRITMLTLQKSTVEADTEYFASLLKVNQKLEAAIRPFKVARLEFSQNTKEDIYGLVDDVGALIGAFYMLSWELSKIEDKYMSYLNAIKRDIDKIEQSISVLQAISDRYLDLSYYKKIREESDALSEVNSTAIKKAYEFIMGKIGYLAEKDGSIRAIKSSPYIYLQSIFQFKGAPSSGGKESLLAIDEAQGVAPEELRLLRDINDNQTIMNLYGDIYQHIEGTKGVDSWEDFKEIIDFDSYEMQENYRNASQITDYCNHTFGMKMNAINTPGRGVHEITTDIEFQSEVVSQLIDSHRKGLGAILIGDDREAQYIMDRFPSYKQKFHDLTGGKLDIHPTKWNIMNINDAKGLEFRTAIVLFGRMSKNQRYIACTRALDNLYIYDKVVDINGCEDKKFSNPINN